MADDRLWMASPDFHPSFQTIAGWASDNRGAVFRYLTYKKLFTPYEQENKFMDESQFEDIHYSYGKLEGVFDLGSGEVLLAFRELLDGYNPCTSKDDFEETGMTVYRRLSDIQLYKFDCDAGIEVVSEDET